MEMRQIDGKNEISTGIPVLAPVEKSVESVHNLVNIPGKVPPQPSATVEKWDEFTTSAVFIKMTSGDSGKNSCFFKLTVDI